MKTVTFDNTHESKKAVLQMFGKTVNDEGFIIEIKTGAKVVSPSNVPIHIDQFAGIRPGSEVFVTNDLPTLLEQAEYFKD